MTSEPIARHHGRQVQIFTADPAAEARRRQERHVSGQCPEIPDMVGRAFQLQHDILRQPRCRRRPWRTAQSLDQTAVAAAVGQRGIARRHGGQMVAPRIGPAAEEGFDAAVLVTEADFQRMNGFAITLKPEMSGFDHAGVDRSDRHLVNGVAVDPIILLIARLDAAGGKAQRLEPWVMQYRNAVLLGDLPLESIEAGAVRGQRFEFGADETSRQLQHLRPRSTQYRQQLPGAFRRFHRQRPEGQQTPIVVQNLIQQPFPEFAECHDRDCRQRRAPAIVQGEKVLAHRPLQHYFDRSIEHVCQNRPDRQRRQPHQQRNRPQFFTGNRRQRIRLPVAGAHAHLDHRLRHAGENHEEQQQNYSAQHRSGAPDQHELRHKQRRRRRPRNQKQPRQPQNRIARHPFQQTADIPDRADAAAKLNVAGKQ
ncbi:hypothetical protein SDC9_129833 [bioreactor metagenome]|uniref:Uncharacterized protein n=1 Tax=bioreactor metagenome TaxID=1076179 RepID=A0A645D0Z5_9ZZZZ